MKWVVVYRIFLNHNVLMTVGISLKRSVL